MIRQSTSYLVVGCGVEEERGVPSPTSVHNRLEFNYATIKGFA